ncbi:MAG: hypothetical protein CR967_04085 [Proteobacteria bacterium]|nr:MAG: hypothetical protein CR967_04085 [Pseudomonadota bacterium]
MEEKNIIKQIKDLSKQVSFYGGNFDLDAHSKKLVLEDKNDNLHAVVPLETLNRILNALKEAKEESFQLKLEKAIWKYVPIDFADTWAVVMNELENSNEDIMSDKNLNKIVKNVKKKHPNLFLNLDDFLPGEVRHISR